MRKLPFLTLILVLCALLLNPVTPRAAAQACAFSLQPGSPTVCVGGSFSLSVNTVGFGGTVTYQWYLNNIPIGNSNVQTLTVNNVTLTDAGPYKCLVTRSGGLGNCSSFSNVGNVTVNTPVSAQPNSVAQLICPSTGTPFTLRVLVTSGTGPITYRWYRDGSPMADGGRFFGTGTEQLNCTSSFSGDADGTWSCQVTGACGAIMVPVPSPVSSSPPTFTPPLPDYIAVVTGRSFSLTGIASGLGINDLRWYVNGQRLVNNFGEPFSLYYDVPPNSMTIWTGALAPSVDNATLEFRATNTCYDTNSSFVHLLTGDGGEAEPNNDKSHTNNFAMTGGYRVVGNAADGDQDWYRLDSPATGAAIHRRTVQLQSPDGSHQMYLKGLSQDFGTVTNSIIDVQLWGNLNTTPSVRYYTCGESPQSIYLVVRGTAGTPKPYRITFVDEPQPTLALDGPPLEPHTPFTISVTGGPGADSDIWCTDRNGNNIPGFGNDEGYAGNHLSLFTRTTGAPGESMRIAFSNWDMANNLPSPADDLYRYGNAVDSPGVTLTSSSSFGQVMTLTVTQNGITRTAQAAITEPRQVLWFDLPVRSCSPADVGSQGGVTGPDNLLDNNDFIAFIDLFFNADPRADLGVQGGILGHDGAFDNNDFIAFINLFFAGCS